jgi:two-component system sensor histidine kinase ArlS
LSRRIELAPGKDELHQMAQTFNAMLDQIEASMEREKRFSSDVSHELRTPVAAIMAESEYAGTYVESVDEAKESFRTIHGQSKRMSVMINQLLELARMDKTDAIKLEPVDLREVLQDTVQGYRLLASQNGINLTTDIPHKAAPIRGQALLLQRAVGNLLDNALKFTRSSIVLHLRETPDAYVIEVQDDGQGMTEDEVKKVWERFYQADSSRNRKTNKGLGLGLAFVAQVLRIHHGSYRAESALGKGSTFYLEIPKITCR